MVWLILSSIFCWLAGGRGWPPFRKGYRRWLWPLMAGILLACTGLLWWKALAISLSLTLVNSLGYGTGSPWLITKMTVFASYVLPSAWMSVTYLPHLLGVSLVFLTVWWVLSQRINVWTQITWESLAAVLQASSLIIGRLAG